MNFDFETPGVCYTFFLFIPVKMASVKKQSMGEFKSQGGGSSKYEIFRKKI